VLRLLFPHKESLDLIYEKYLKELTSYPLDKIVNDEYTHLKQVTQIKSFLVSNVL
jgi:hypothetical protein